MWDEFVCMYVWNQQLTLGVFFNCCLAYILGSLSHFNPEVSDLPYLAIFILLQRTQVFATQVLGFQMGFPTCLAFMWVLGYERQPSGMQGKCISHWAISSTPED